MKKIWKIVIELVLLVAILGLVYAIYNSIMQPVNFNKLHAIYKMLSHQSCT